MKSVDTGMVEMNKLSSTLKAPSLEFTTIGVLASGIFTPSNLLHGEYCIGSGPWRVRVVKHPFSESPPQDHPDVILPDVGTLPVVEVLV